MFTGLVQAVGRVASIEKSGSGAKLVIDAGAWPSAPEPGESISISGCCLTLVAPAEAAPTSTPPLLRFDVVAETLARTTLGALRPGARVNLERSVRPDTLMGGHVVQGHVEGVGEVIRVDAREGDWRIAVRPPAELIDCIVPKGAIALEGVSLTIASVSDAGDFEIALIPTTLGATNLADLKPGAGCNIETDIVARTVVHWLRRNTQR